jgi:hypothetical protein
MLRIRNTIFVLAALVAVFGLVSVSSASLLGVEGTQVHPLLAYFYGPTSYDPGTGEFTVDATADTIQLEASGPPVTIGGAAKFIINVVVNATGGLVGGVSGDYLVVSGDVTLDSSSYSGDLLTGEVTGFGFLNSVGVDTDYYDFTFKLTGGLLADLFGGVGAEVGVSLTSEGSTFAGLFNESFGGQAKGDLGAMSKPCIEIKKQVKKKKECSYDCSYKYSCGSCFYGGYSYGYPCGYDKYSCDSTEWVDADTMEDALTICDAVEFRLIVKNCGNVDLYDVRITDLKLDIDQTIDFLEAGQELTITKDTPGFGALYQSNFCDEDCWDWEKVCEKKWYYCGYKYECYWKKVPCDKKTENVAVVEAFTEDGMAGMMVEDEDSAWVICDSDCGDSKCDYGCGSCYDGYKSYSGCGSYYDGYKSYSGYNSYYDGYKSYSNSYYWWW